MILSNEAATSELSDDQLNHISGDGGVVGDVVGLAAASFLGNAIGGGGIVETTLRGLATTIRGISQR
jgi:hypothetical protein